MDIESLRKVLDLEKQRNYNNTAVFGGLDKFIKNWSTGVIESIKTPKLLGRFNKLFKVDYASMSPGQRTDWVQNVLKFLDDLSKKPNVIPPPPKELEDSSEKKKAPTTSH